jgi:hypothetical protein
MREATKDGWIRWMVLSLSWGELGWRASSVEGRTGEVDAVVELVETIAEDLGTISIETDRTF